MTEEQKKEQRLRIGARIAELRKQAVWMDDSGWQHRGMTQRDLAAKCGLHDTHIARIEKGKYSVGFDTLEALAEAMGCRVEIVGGAAFEQ
jgi:DNA-binding Xre family transcriptional regulator